MEAIEKTIINTAWIALFILFLFACLALLHTLAPRKMKGYYFSFFNIIFTEEETKEYSSFFNAFYVLFFIFSMGVFSLCSYLFLQAYFPTFKTSVSNFGYILVCIISYFLIKRGLEYLLSLLFQINREVRFFLISKTIYLNTISTFLLYILVLLCFTSIPKEWLFILLLLFFSIRYIVHIITNKILIKNSLFYFILYICTFEITPLLIAYKLML